MSGDNQIPESIQTPTYSGPDRRRDLGSKSTELREGALKLYRDAKAHLKREPSVQEVMDFGLRRKDISDQSDAMRVEIATLFRENLAMARTTSVPTEVASGHTEAIELTDAQKTTVALLRVNFTKYEEKLNSGINFNDFEAYLKADPSRIEKLTALAHRGGELTPVSNHYGKFQLEELASESSTADRNMGYKKAVTTAKDKYGANLMSSDRYRALVGQGFRFNYSTWDWLATDDENVKAGLAFYGNGGYVGKRNADICARNRGFRSALEV